MDHVGSVFNLRAVIFEVLNSSLVLLYNDAWFVLTLRTAGMETFRKVRLGSTNVK